MNKFQKNTYKIDFGQPKFDNDLRVKGKKQEHNQQP